MVGDKESKMNFSIFLPLLLCIPKPLSVSCLAIILALTAHLGRFTLDSSLLELLMVVNGNRLLSISYPVLCKADSLAFESMVKWENTWKAKI